MPVQQEAVTVPSTVLIKIIGHQWCFKLKFFSGGVTLDNCEGFVCHFSNSYIILLN